MFLLRQKQASKLAEQLQQTQLQQKHMAMPLQTSLETPPPPPTRSWGNGSIGSILTLPKFHLASLKLLARQFYQYLYNCFNIIFLTLIQNDDAKGRWRIGGGINREVKHDVYGKRQTAKTKLLPSVFSSLYSRIKIFVFAVNSKRHFSIFV